MQDQAAHAAKANITTIALLPKQLELMQDTTTKLLGYIGGYGSGKSYSGAFKILQILVLNNGNADALALEPSYSLVQQVMRPAIELALALTGMTYVYKAALNTYLITINGNECRLILGSAENYTKLIGLNLCGIWWDEADTSRQDLAQEIFDKLIGRIRVGKHRQFLFTSTPEGIKFLYKLFVTKKDENGSRYIKVNSLDNFHLPQDFFDTLYQNYNPTQLRAFLEGEFVNLNTESVFDFERQFNHAEITIDTDDTDIYFAADFNVGGCVTLSALFINDIIYVFDEIITHDTFETRDLIRDRFPTQDLWMTADTSGGNNSTNSHQSNHDLLLEIPKLSMIQGPRNPSIVDSINSVNAALRNQKLFIDTDKCPKLTLALQQHAYDKHGKPEKFSEHKGGSTDDFSDCIRYLTHTLLPIRKPVFHQYNQI